MLMKKKERNNSKHKKKWTAPYIRNLKIINTFNGEHAGELEGATYNGTVSNNI